MLGGDNLEGWDDILNTDDRLATLVGTWNSNIQVPNSHQLWRDILQLNHVEELELFAKTLEDGVVDIPCLLDFGTILSYTVTLEMLASDTQIMAERLDKGRLTQGLRSLRTLLVLSSKSCHKTYVFDNLMQRLKDPQHARYIMVTKVVLRCFFQTIIPHFMPQDSRSNKLSADKLGLINDLGRVLSHFVGDILSDIASGSDCRFGGDSKRVDKGLRMSFANIVQELHNELLYRLAGRLDTSNDLQKDHINTLRATTR